MRGPLYAGVRTSLEVPPAAGMQHFDLTPAKHIPVINTERGVLRGPYAKALKEMELMSYRVLDRGLQRMNAGSASA